MSEADANALLLRTVLGSLWWFCTGVGGVGAVATIIRLSTSEPVAIFRKLAVAAAITNATLALVSSFMAAYEVGPGLRAAVWVVVACQVLLAAGNVLVLSRRPGADGEGDP